MEHAFSVELKSRRHVRHMLLSKGSRDQVLFEGFLGELEGVSIIEGVLLEIRGTNGVLRMDLSEEELRIMLTPKKADQ